MSLYSVRVGARRSEGVGAIVEQKVNKMPSSVRMRKALEALADMPPGWGGVEEGFDEVEAAVGQDVTWRPGHEGAE